MCDRRCVGGCARRFIIGFCVRGYVRGCVSVCERVLTTGGYVLIDDIARTNV